MIEPLVDKYVDGNEIISTEDLKARVENKDWTHWSWWEGKKTECGRYICCTKCVGGLSEIVPRSPAGSEDECGDGEQGGDDGDVCKCVLMSVYKDVEKWEEFWETPEGQDTSFWTLSEEEWLQKNPKKIGPKKMRQLRRVEWEEKQKKEDLEDNFKIWKTEEVLPEAIQDFEKEMVVVGCDVEALYPSLDPVECGRIVEEEIMRTSIRCWKQVPPQ